MKRTKRRVTNRDVAQRAGVSTAVVSYVLNDGPRPVSPEIRERVLEAARALDYHPHAIARGLRNRRSNTIGFIVADFMPQTTFVAPYTTGILNGIVDELKQRDHYLIIFHIGVGENVDKLRDLLREGRLDGIIVRFPENPAANDQLLELIVNSKLPCVCLEREASSAHHYPSITIDEVAGATTATRFLIERGHRRIAHIVGDLRMRSAQIRLESYKNTLLAHGLPFDPLLVQGGSWTAKDATLAAHRLFDLADPPTAIFAANDNLAFNAIRVARERGLRVPQDVAVLGYDDAPIEYDLLSSLTTMRLPLERMGRQAAELILKQVAGEEAGSIVIVPELVQRGST